MSRSTTVNKQRANAGAAATLPAPGEDREERGAKGLPQPPSGNGAALQTSAEPARGEDRRSARHLNPEQILPSPHNPRKHYDQAELDELATSIGRHGLLQPILVRPVPAKKGAPGHYEIVCGERRYRAAKLAQLRSIPVLIDDSLTDLDVLEIHVVENIHRADLGPLEEAEGYHQLIAAGKYDVRSLAKRLGKSPKYIYDRIKLRDLVPAARQLLAAGRITPGHAILLARLSEKDQQRAIDPEDVPENEWAAGQALFTHERARELFDDEYGEKERRKDPWAGLKARSVRELEAWINKHVRFPVREPDPMLFPETAQAVSQAAAAKRKVLLVTNEHMVSHEVRGAGDERIYSNRTWKRADGEPWRDHSKWQAREEKSKTCEKSQLGVVVSGPGRGEAFQVCVSKSCPVHWPEDVRKAKRRASAAAKKGEPAAAAAPPKRQAQRMGPDEVLQEAAESLDPLICAAAAKADVVDVLRLALGANGWAMRHGAERAGLGKKFGHRKALETATLGELKAILVGMSLDDPEDVGRMVAAFKVDPAKVRQLLRAARVRLVKESGNHLGVCGKCGCVDEDACETPAGPCAWVDKDHHMCSACYPEFEGMREGKASKPKKGTAPKKSGRKGVRK